MAEGYFGTHMFLIQLYLSDYGTCCTNHMKDINIAVPAVLSSFCFTCHVRNERALADCLYYIKLNNTNLLKHWVSWGCGYEFSNLLGNGVVSVCIYLRIFGGSCYLSLHGKWILPGIQRWKQQIHPFKYVTSNKRHGVLSPRPLTFLVKRIVFISYPESGLSVLLLLSIGPRWLMPRMYCSHIGLLYYP